MKRCPGCGEIKSTDSFPRNKRTKDGLAYYCKACHNRKGRESRARNHGSSRNYHLKARYGIGAADVEALITAQGGVCAVCRLGKPEHVDHDHATGLVRGMLCFGCNGGLGQFKDDPNRLLAALRYLADPPARAVLGPQDGSVGPAE